MGGDDDIQAALPAPPPPSPARREAAIAGALARFDGVGETGTDRVPGPAAPPAWWRRPQAGAMLAAALFAAIGLPLAWTTLNSGTGPLGDRPVPTVTDAARPAAFEVADASRNTAPAILPPPAKRAAPAASAPPAPAPVVAASPGKPQAKPADVAFAVPVRVTPPAPPPPPVVTGKAAANDEVVVTAARAGRSAAAPPPASVAAAPAADALREDVGTVVVTGTRIASPEKKKRGDWNACTIDDPGRMVSRCTKLADKGSKDVRSQADAYLADGLARGWDSDWRGAIAAFDRALAIAPGLSIAHLNRGLAYDRIGDEAHALADLDQAVRAAPRAARGYYHRSRILAKYGETQRARADARRAIDLDDRYKPLLR